MNILSFFKRNQRNKDYGYLTPFRSIVSLNNPYRVSLMLKQDGCIPAIPIVNEGDKVKRGQKIAEAACRLSVPVFASISGTVKNIGKVKNISGDYEEAITITASDLDRELDERDMIEEIPLRDWHGMQSDELIDVIAEAGCMDFFGTPMPAATKLSSENASLIIVNGMEYNSFLTCDESLMWRAASEIVEGIEIMMCTSKVSNAIVVIGDNRPEAYKSMRKASADTPGIKIQRIRITNNIRKEKNLIRKITGIKVPEGDTSLSLGIIVCNVSTAYEIFYTVVKGRPLVDKMITVTGRGNYQFPLGMYLSEMPIDPSNSQTSNEIMAIGETSNAQPMPIPEAPVDKSTYGIITHSYLFF